MPGCYYLLYSKSTGILDDHLRFYSNLNCLSDSWNKMYKPFPSHLTTFF